SAGTSAPSRWASASSKGSHVGFEYRPYARAPLATSPVPTYVEDRVIGGFTGVSSPRAGRPRSTTRVAGLLTRCGDIDMPPQYPCGSDSLHPVRNPRPSLRGTMTAQIIALAIFIALFAVGAIRGVHIGVLMFSGAAGTALLLTDMPLEYFVAGFPLSQVVLLAGVTLFFAIAQLNGTIDKLIDRALSRVGSNVLLLPLVFFLITAAIASMGAPLAGLVMMPVGMQVARRYGLAFALMSLAVCLEIGPGGCDTPTPLGH